MIFFIAQLDSCMTSRSVVMIIFAAVVCMVPSLQRAAARQLQGQQLHRCLDRGLFHREVRIVTSLSMVFLIVMASIAISFIAVVCIMSSGLTSSSPHCRDHHGHLVVVSPFVAVVVADSSIVKFCIMIVRIMILLIVMVSIALFFIAVVCIMNSCLNSSSPHFRVHHGRLVVIFFLPRSLLQFLPR